MASYQIDSSNPSPQFFEARNVAGATLEQQFNLLPKSDSPSRDVKWLKADLTWPSFDHLTFAYRDAVFSVLVDIVEGSESSLEPKATKRCLDAAAAHNLIPCVFRVDRRTMQPSSGGWNLFDLRDGTAVDPAQASDNGTVPMSDWEIQSFSVQVVRGHITEQLGGKEHSFCDVPGIDPQIWFQDSKGNNGWVAVRHFPVITGEEKNDWLSFASTNPKLREFDGYLAAVSIASSAPVLRDEQGKIIPPSERFTGKAPLYRGDPFYVKFEGLQRIHVA
jgi:hypothetical protein